MINQADALRNAHDVSDPDPRTKFLVIIDGSNQLLRSVTIEDQLASISSYILNQSAPEDIAIHFETAKNLYLYAWHVYRFYPVAEQQALATLEYALRLRLSEFVDQFKKEKRGREPTLYPLLKYVRDTGLVMNDLFPSRNKWATRIAKERFSAQISTKMTSEGLDEIVYDDSHVTPTEDDLNHDWLSDFIELMPRLRNDLAHGSSTLRPSVIHTFDIVSSIINQLYPNVQNPHKSE
jgi:hypothetical protein